MIAQLERIKGLGLAVLVMALAACTARPLALSATPTPEVPRYCRLQVDGDRVTDSTGKTIVLHGATLPPLIDMEASDRKPPQRLRKLADAGARVVRLPITEREMTPTFVPGTVSPFIDQAHELGILVILSYQNDTALAANDQGDNSEDWIRLALPYLRTAPGVWFEPLANAVDTPKWEGLNQRTIDVMRGYSADNIMFINNPVWLKESKPDLAGGNIVRRVDTLDGWPTQLKPVAVVSGDVAVLQNAQKAGAWAIASDDTITDALKQLWQTSQTCG